MMYTVLMSTTATDTCVHGLSADLCYGPNHYGEDDFRDDDFGPRLWDATPGVCCAAFQLGACDHTEGYDAYDYDDEYDEAAAEQATILATVITAEEPF